VGAVTRGPAVAMDGAWHFTITPYMWFSGISGDISVANLAEIPVEVRFSDMIEDVDVGLGWRHMDIDYDKGEGLDRQVFEIACDGPRLWLACVW